MAARTANNRLLTFGAIIIAAALFLFVGGRSGVLRPFTSVLMAPLAPLARLLNQGAGAGGEAFAAREDYATLAEDNQALEQSLAELQVEIVRLREIEQDYLQLSQLLDYNAQSPDQTLVTADVIGRDTSGYLRWIIINRGVRDGIQQGAPVITGLGLVGRVEEVAATASWVKLIIDQSSTVNVRLQTARAEGTVIGQLQGTLRMQFIPQEAVVEVGDLVLTSGLGGRFPPNIVIGQVSNVQRQEASPFQEAEIRPVVDFDALDIVGVIIGFEPIDLTVFDDVIEQESQGDQ